MLGILLAILVPLVFNVIPAVALGIKKDGSPFRKDWWTS